MVTFGDTHARPSLPRARRDHGRRLRRLQRRSCKKHYVMLDPGRAPRDDPPRGARRWRADGPDAQAATTGLLDEVTGLVEWPVVLIGRDRPALHGPAAGGADHLDARASEILRADRRRTASWRRASSWSPTCTTDGRRHGRSSPATSACCARACPTPVLLGPGPQGEAGRPRAGARRASCSTPSSARSPTRSTRMETLAAELATIIPGADRDQVALRRAAGQGRPRHRHGRRVPRAAGRHGPLLRAARRRGRRRSPTRSREHYTPLGPNDRCPTAPVSVAVALADKLDTLVGFFAIDEKPTGSKDPFALRRAALGVIRLIVENKLRLPLRLPACSRTAHQLQGDRQADRRRRSRPTSCSTSSPTA